MFRVTIGTVALLAAVLAGWSGNATAADRPGCVPYRPHRHVAAVRHRPVHVVYSRFSARPRPYNYEDNGRYDADVPPAIPVGQPASWLDGYGTRPVVVPGYGAYNAYGGSSQVWPLPIQPAGGLAVYSPGAYGPGPRIIHIPGG